MAKLILLWIIALASAVNAGIFLGLGIVESTIGKKSKGILQVIIGGISIAIYVVIASIYLR